MVSKKRPVLIGIAGGSGSGKTYLSRAVQHGAGDANVAVLSMDQYFFGDGAEDRRQTNFDHPGYIDFKLLIRHLKSLKRGRTIHAPTYDFRSRKPSPHSLRVASRPIVLVEGLFVLADPIHHLFDLTCFLDVESDQRLLGRILRDMEEREADVDSIVDRYQRFVRPCYDIFVAPTKNNADVVVDFTYRRAFFTEMLTHIAHDYVVGDLDIDALLERIRRSVFHMGYQAKDTAMPMSIDIFKLAKAYPPSMNLEVVPETLETSPRLLVDPSSRPLRQVRRNRK